MSDQQPGWYVYSDKMSLAKVADRFTALEAYAWLEHHGTVTDAPIDQVEAGYATETTGLIRIQYPVQMNSTHLKITYSAPMPVEWVYDELRKAETMILTEKSRINR
ncbi:hypothetical protein AGMMS49992_26880 [Clostridia bacterium]|nr:hypothetical protein AGMMS49992_26880 [Clostridia bacterium]